MKGLADRLKKALEAKGASASDLARACGVKQPSVSAWLSRSTKQMKAENLRKAAQFLGVRQRWLEDGRGPMKDGEATPAGQIQEYLSADEMQLVKLHAQLTPAQQRLAVAVMREFSGIRADEPSLPTGEHS